MSSNVYVQISSIGEGELVHQEEIIHKNQLVKKWIPLQYRWLDDVTPVTFLFEPFEIMPEIGFRVYSSRPRSSEKVQSRVIDGLQLSQESLSFDSDRSRRGRRVFNLVNGASRGGFLVRSEAGIDLAIETLVVIENQLVLQQLRASTEHRLVVNF